jgi:F0F1-type ATP synthase membrane subunit b/b'
MRLLTKTVAPLIDAVAEIKSVATELKFMASTRMEQIEKDVAENKSQAKEAKVLAYENQRKVDGLEREVSTLISETKAQGISILKHNNYLQMGFGAFVIGQVIWNIYKHLNG